MKQYLTEQQVDAERDSAYDLAQSGTQKSLMVVRMRLGMLANEIAAGCITQDEITNRLDQARKEIHHLAHYVQ